MTTNATVEAWHKDMAAEAFGYSSWTRLSHSEGPRITAIALAQAQDKANLEAARAENADLTNRLAEIDRIAGERGWTNKGPFTPAWASHVAALASGHTPSPCPSCAAKDEAMEAMRADLVEIDGLLTNAPDSPSVIADAKAIAAPYRIPPADPLAEALKIAEAALAELKSRLGGAK